LQNVCSPRQTDCLRRAAADPKQAKFSFWSNIELNGCCGGVFIVAANVVNVLAPSAEAATAAAAAPAAAASPPARV
jgi:hypothetical protein